MQHRLSLFLAEVLFYIWLAFLIGKIIRYLVR